MDSKIDHMLDAGLAYLYTLGNLVTSDLELFYVERCEQLLRAIKYELPNDNINNNEEK